MSIADVKFYNLLVHFGPEYSYNLRELLELAFLDLGTGKEVIKLPNFGNLQMRELRYFKQDDQYYLTGLLYKTGVVAWEYIPDSNRDPQIAPGTQSVMPYSRFILSISDHRIFWITKRGLSLAPSIGDFCSFIKRVTLPYLRSLFTAQAEIEWQSELEERDDDTAVNKFAKRKFIFEYLKIFKLTSGLMEVRYVAETSKDKVKDLIFDPKYVIKNATFFPHMNNVTDEECRELFTDADSIANQANAKASLVLTPKIPKEGVLKEVVGQMLDINERLNLLKFKFSLKNKNNKDEKVVTVSNLDETLLSTEERVVSASIIKTAVTDRDAKLAETAKQLIEENPDMKGTGKIEQTVLEKLLAKVRPINE